MKILCFIDSLGSGGAQRQLVEIAKCLQENGNEVSFLVYHDEPFYNDVLNNLNIPITLIYEKSYLKRIFKIRKYLRQEKNDVVISFLEGANFIAELSAIPFKKWKLIVGERSANPGILKSPKLRLYRFFHVFADYIVSNSYTNMELVNKCAPFLSKKKQKVIYNLLHESDWEASEGVKLNGKRKLIVASSHQYLKNSRGLIEAYSLLSKNEQKSLEVEWYGGMGSDDSFSESIKLLKEYGLEKNIHFYPPTNQIKDKMTQGDIVGLFSFYEGLPNVVCEAMMLGKMVIASNVSDIPLLIQEKDFLFEPSDVNQIKSVLKKAINLSDEQIKEQGMKNKVRSTELFSSEYIINQYLSIINK